MKLCLLDQDNVITDFHAGVMEWFKIPQSTITKQLSWMYILDITGLTLEEFWKAITVDFWINLPWTKDGKEILSIVEDYFGPENVFILTHPSNQLSAYEGKRLWLEKHMPEYFKGERYHFGKHKHICANPEHLLVDDADHNIDDFVKAGGIGCLIPRLWNRLRNVEDTTKGLKEILNATATRTS